MNKAHRVIWSRVRNCFVVASETTKTRGKPASTRKAIAAAVAALFTVPGAAFAAGITIGNIDKTIPPNITSTNSAAIFVNTNYSRTLLNNGSLIGNLLSDDAVVYIVGDVTGTITNNGLIDANASVNGGSNISGIYIDGDLKGTLTNSNTGTITVSGAGTNATSYFGIRIDSDIGSSGKLNNAGTIGVSLTAASTTGSAWGIYVEDYLKGSLTNSGTISVIANNAGEIDTDTANGGSATNSFNVTGGVYVTYSAAETASAEASASARANATGIYIGDDLDGSLTNSGSISAIANNIGTTSATAENRRDASISGNITGGTFSDDVYVSAYVDAYANASARANAYGIDIYNNLDGDLTNSGDITASAFNSGTVSASASNYAYARARATVDGGTFYDNIYITASAVAYAEASASAFATGIHIGDDLDGSLTNSGSISAIASNTGTVSAFAYGDSGAYAHATGNVTSDANYVYSSFISNITAEASAYASAYASANATGIYVGQDLVGDLTNSGGILAVAANSGTISAYAINYTDAYAGTSGTSAVTGDVNYADLSANAGAYAIASAAAEADGINVSGNLDGSLTNSGSIGAFAYNSGTVSAVATNKSQGSARAESEYSFGDNSAYASAYAFASVSALAVGIEVSDGDLDGSLTNSGSIIAGAVNSGYTRAYAGNHADASANLYAYVYPNADANASAYAHARAGVSATAFGIYINSGIGGSGSLTNSGSISAFAVNSGSTSAFALNNGEAAATQVNTEYNDSSDVENAAYGYAEAEAEVSAAAYGIYISRGINSGSLTNSGGISALAVNSGEDIAFAVNSGEDIANGANYSYAYAYHLTTAFADAQASDSARAFGIVVGGDLDGNLINSGSISASAMNSGHVQAYAFNYGSATTTAYSYAYATATAYAYAYANAEANASAYGIYVSDHLNGSLTNSGSIIASAVNSGEDGVDAIAINHGTANAHSLVRYDYAYSYSYASASARANASAQATGIYVGGEIDGNASLTNSGSIIAFAGNSGEDTALAYNDGDAVAYAGDKTGSSYAYAYAYARARVDVNASAAGIHIYGALDGDLTNSGSILAIAENSGSAFAYAANAGSAYAYGDGAKESEAYAEADASAYARAYGINVSGDLNGSLTNSGSIIASAVNSGEDIAIAFSRDPQLEDFDRFSTTSAEADASAYARAYGINIGGELNGSLTNSGSIIASAANSGEDTAVAVAAGDLTFNGLVNIGGTLSRYTNADADASASAYALAYGIRVNGDLNGSLTNSGSISAFASNSSSEFAFATALGEDDISTATLSGTLRAYINAYAEADASASATALGIRVGGELNGSLTNSGSIIASAVNSGEDIALAEAFATADASTTTVSGIFSRYDNIRAYADASASASARATGIRVNGDLIGSLTNSGSIIASAENSGEDSAVALALGEDTASATVTGGDSLYTYAYINANAYAQADGDATARGIYFSGKIDDNASLTNSGSIIASAVNSGFALAYAGAGADSTVSGFGGTPGAVGSDVNARADAQADFDASATGIYIGSTLSGSLDNSGSIFASAVNSGYVVAEASAYANADTPAQTSSFVNLPGYDDVSASAYAEASAYAIAYGILIGNTLSGSLTNSGSIFAGASNSGDVSAIATLTAKAEGLNAYADNDEDNPTNRAYASAYASANAYGIDIYNNLDGDLTNTGSIIAIASNSGDVSATATSTARALGLNAAFAYAYAEADASAYAQAYGIHIEGNLNGTLTNTGSIFVSASNSGTISALATATATRDSLNNAVINSTGAHAYAYADVFVSARATGIEMDGSLDGSLTNTGSIIVNAGNSVTASAIASATATGDFNLSTYSTSSVEVYAYADGIHIDNDLGGSLTNTGSIIATATNAPGISGNYYYAEAHGIFINDTLLGEITNSGSIIATADSPDNGLKNTIENGAAFGVFARTITGTLNNSGLIRGLGLGGVDDENVYSVFGEDNEDWQNHGTVNNLAGGLLDGQIFVGGEDIDVNNSGIIDTRLNSSFVSGEFTQSKMAANFTDPPTGIFKIWALDINGDNSGDGSCDNNTGVGTGFGCIDVEEDVHLATGSGIRVKVPLGAANPLFTIAAGDKLNNVIHTQGSTLYTDAISDPLAGASGGVDAAPGDLSATIHVTDNIMAYNFVPIKDSYENIDLDVIATGFDSIHTAVHQDGLDTGSGAARVLDSLLPGIDELPQEMSEWLYGVGGMRTSGEVADAVEQVLPLMSGGTSLATLAAMEDINHVIQARLEGQNGRSTGDQFMGDSRFWLKPFGSWANQDNRDGTHGFSADTYGMLFGADTVIKDSARLGVAFGYYRSNVDGNGNSHQGNPSADVDSYQGIFYGSYGLSEETDINFQLDYGRHNNNGRRHIIGVGTAKSDWDGDSWHGGIGLAHTLKWTEQTSFTPSVRIDYTWLRDDSYTEKGVGAFNLNVDSQTTEALIFAVDGKLDYAMTETTDLTANLGIGYDAINDDASLTSAFAGVPTASFVTKGIDPSPWMVRGGLGVVGRLSESMEITARYDFDLRDDFDNQTASLKVRWAF